MIFRKYAKYKASGVEWLGEVPKHWSTQAVWMGFELGRGRVISKGELQDNPGDYPVYSSQTEREGEFGRLNTYDFDGHYITWTTDGAHAGTTFERRGKFNCTNVCGTLKSRTKELNLTFYRYAIDVAAKWYVRHDINPKLMNNVMASIRIPKFSLAEQNQIAAFLDKETTKIDTLVDKQGQLITLLREKRQAMISHVVTKGLDPNVKMKDSGIEWLGKVPVEWQVKKLKFVATVQPSNVDKKSKENEKEVLLCNYTDVYYNEEITADLPFMKATASDVQIRKFTLKRGDTIITKDSEDPNDIAVPAYVPRDLEGVVCGYHLALLRPGKGTCGGYLKRVMDTQYARSFFATRANGITRYGLVTYAISNFIIPLPPLGEQKRIATFLDKETTKIDTLIEKCETAIELLKERRTALIAAAVTGKIDVRNAV